MSDADLTVHPNFPRYDYRDPLVPVWNLTPGRGGCIVRFFDTPAVSPSGRYVACFRLPFEDRLPAPGDAGEVVLIDLHAGTERAVATTRGWEPQLGAQVNWGGDDRTLLFSDVDTQTWTPFTAAVDPLGDGAPRRLDGPIYHASPDGRTVVGTNPLLMCRTQRGYGVVAPESALPPRRGAPADDGVWLTDTDTGKKRLLHSLADVVARFAEPLGIEDVDDWQVYAFHSKFAPTGDRLLFTLRYFRAGHAGGEPIGDRSSGLRFAILTCRPDGSDLSLDVGPEAWVHGGHHINFYPDGKSLSMNLGGLADPPRDLRFARADVGRTARPDRPGGPDRPRPILPDLPGSGHQSVHPDGRHLLTDCYAHERWTDPADGTTPLRWVDLRDGTDREIARVRTVQPHQPSTLRIDPHPCWDRSWRFVTFTTFEGGTRRVFLADLRSLIDA